MAETVAASRRSPSDRRSPCGDRALNVRSRWAALVVAASVLVGCSSDAGVSIDGPRHPDDFGVATDLSRAEITLDDERTYPVSSDLISFSTYTGEIEPMLSRAGQYVLVGLRDGEMVWMAGLGRPIDLGDRKVALYNGQLVEIDDGSLVFADGTVIPLADGVAEPRSALGANIQVELAVGGGGATAVLGPTGSPIED